MYICNECGETFWEPRQIVCSQHPEPEYEATVCPYCESGDYEQAYTCDNCGAAIPESQDAFHLCKECEAKLAEKFQAHLDKYTQNELDFLSWKWEGYAFERSKKE